MFTNKLYTLSPIRLQNFLISLRALIRRLLRETSRTRQLVGELEALERNDQALSLYRENELNKTIANAVTNVPFYCSIDADSIENFPYITKRDVKTNPAGFHSRLRPYFTVSGSTSGTTGTPLSIPQDMASVVREQAFISRSLKWAGYKPGDKRAWIRGDLIVPIKQKQPPYWRYSWFENVILLSSFHMTSKALPQYIEAMVNYGVDIIQAYPSSILTLAQYLKINDLYYPSQLKSVLTSSESLTKEDRNLVEERFQCPVFDWYGLFERVAAIATCEHGRYHILTDYSYVELLDKKNGTYEIVGTSFHNRAFPLIRYKTGDHVTLSQDSKCRCNRVYPVIDSIEGRIGDYLIAEDGQKIHILNHIPRGVEGVIASQFIQNERGKVVVCVVADTQLFDETQKEKLRSNVKERLGENIKVEIECTSKLRRTRNGKVRQAICTIEVGNGQQE